MSILATNLTSSGGARPSTDAASYSTAAVAPSASYLVLVAVLNTKATTPDTPTISGGGVATWVQVDTQLRGSSTRLTIFRGLTATPGSAAAIVIDFAGATQTSCSWSVDEFSGIETSGTDGSAAVVQVVSTDGGAAFSGSATLAAFVSVDNATYGAVYHQANEGSTPGAGFTELADTHGSGPNTGLVTEWRADNDTVVDASWATSAVWIATGIEIAALTTTTITPSSILSAESFGTANVGGQTISPDSIATEEAFGTPTVSGNEAIAATHLTSGRDNVDATSFSTAAVTPAGANHLVLVAVYNTKATTPETPTISGGGVTTWVQIDTQLRGTTARLTIFRGMTASPGSTAAIVIDFAGATQTSCAWSVDDFSGVVTTGTNGSGAIVQADLQDFGAATSSSITLGAFSAVANATYGVFTHAANEGTTPGTGFTELADHAGNSPNTGFMAQWRADNDTTVDASWATSVQSIGAAIEIASASAAGAKTIEPSSISSAEAFGTALVTPLSISPSSITSAEAFGNATVSQAGGAAPWDSELFYEIGDRVTFDGRIWKAIAPTSAQHAPQGVGDGSTEDRDLLLDQLDRGFAGGLVTGGYAGSTYTVTNNNDSGAGSLRTALTTSGPLWIIFDDDYDITFATPVSAKPDKTMDGRCHNISVRGRDIEYFSTLNSGAIPNFIAAYITFEDNYVNLNASSAAKFSGSGNSGDTEEYSNTDKVYFHHCLFTDIRDTMLTFAAANSFECRATVDWSKFGPNPGTTMVAQAGGFRFCTTTVASGNTFTKVGHGFTHNLEVKVYTRGGYTLPAPLSASGTYRIILLDANTFQLSASSNGPAVTLTPTDGGAWIIAQSGQAPYMAGKGVQWGVNHAPNNSPLEDLAANGDSPGFLKGTLTFCDFEHLNIRAPKQNGSWVHEFNCRHYKWGEPEGSINARAGDLDDWSEIKIESTIYVPYSTGDRHVYSDYTSPVEDWLVAASHSNYAVHAEDHAIVEIPTTGSNQNWLHGATVNLLRGATVGTVTFSIPYSYDLVTDEATLNEMLDRGAGNIQPWELEASDTQFITPSSIESEEEFGPSTVVLETTTVTAPAVNITLEPQSSAPSGALSVSANTVALTLQTQSASISGAVSVTADVVSLVVAAQAAGVLSTVSVSSDANLRWSISAFVSDDLRLLWRVLSTTHFTSPLTSAKLLDLEFVGVRTSCFEWEVVDKAGTLLGTINPQDDGLTITNDTTRGIKRDLRGLVLPPSEAGSINALTDRIRPVMVLQNGERHNLGLFLFVDGSTSPHTYGDVFSGSLLDQTFLVDQANPTTINMPTGSSIYSGLVYAMFYVNAPYFVIDNFTATIAQPISWPAGTSMLKVINDLCALSGCYPLYFDNNGIGRIRRVPGNLAATAPAVTYADGVCGAGGGYGNIIEGTTIITDNLLSAPNRFIVIDSASQDAPITAVYDLPDSAPNSYVNRGFRIAEVITEQGLASVSEAYQRAYAAASQSAADYKWISFQGVIDPRHDTFDILQLNGVVVRETKWSLTVKEGAPMTHDVREVYS